MNAVDTNILLYVHDPRDPEKQRKAAALIEGQAEAALLWQVACEYLAASRKLQTLGYGFPQAYEDISDLRAVWSTYYPTWNVLERATRLMSAYSLSYWDAMIAGACLEAGIERLYSEDFGGYPAIDGLEIVDPFRAP